MLNCYFRDSVVLLVIGGILLLTGILKSFIEKKMKPSIYNYGTTSDVIV